MFGIVALALFFTLYIITYFSSKKKKEEPVVQVKVETPDVEEVKEEAKPEPKPQPKKVEIEEYGTQFEIRGNQILNAFGGYLYELSGSNINKVYGGFYTSISGHYITLYDLSVKYEVTGQLYKRSTNVDPFLTLLNLILN